MNQTGLPYFAEGVVCKGFGRGSKDLGIPTANFSEDAINALPTWFDLGVYFGWAQVDGGPVFKMVMSVGWNPFYKNKKRAMEVHILQEFDKQFYGARIKVCVLKFLRPERDFSSVEELIKTIQSDISTAEEELDNCDYLKFKDHEYFGQMIYSS